MKHSFFKPPGHLQSYIRFFWTIDCRGTSKDDNVFKVFARRHPRLIFQHNNGNSAIYHEKDVLPLGYLSGLNCAPYTCGIQSTASATGVSFYPHSIKLFFGINTFEIVDQLPDIQNFVPKELVEKIVETAEQKKRIAILCDFFTQQLKFAKRVDKIATISWSVLNKITVETEVQQLQKKFCISEKQLERQFKATIGLSPKQFLRITRFEKAVNLIKNGKPGKLSDIAYDLNYFDQSHFIREFKEFSNLTPTDYLNQKKIYEENSAMIIKSEKVKNTGLTFV